ncbi:MAG: hypothetical protein KDC38_22045, partial [Planctomycetes bacterium]|nr:hypothetical protein [Planctomycetota bacterium]
TPDEGRGFTLVSDGDGVADPELSASQIDDMEFYLAELGAPQRKNPTDLGVLRGEVLFEEVGCAKCHVPSLMGANGPVNLYSDLLLHDVMPGTYRGMAETGAPAGFFRTTPLWGASESAPYMHDGSAETIQQAIKMHDGEAAGVRAAYNALDGLEKRALVGFVLDL